MAFIKQCILVAFLAIMTRNAVYASTEPYISYTDSGKGETLVLIHAFPTDKTLWLPQQTLTAHFRVITLDLWGFGKSEAVDGRAITMTQYADEVARLLKALQIKQAIIGGESMGGYVALAFWKKYPQQVSGLLLSNTQAIADSAETKAKRETTAVDILQHGSEVFIKNFLANVLSDQASESTRSGLANLLKGQAPQAFASALRGMAVREDNSALLANSHDLPILIITSDQDKVISPQQSQAMHDLAKGSHLVVLQGVGHLSNLESPAQWNRAVLDYFHFR